MSFCQRLTGSIFTLVASILIAAPSAEGEAPCDDLGATRVAQTTPRHADLACIGRWIETEQSWPTGTRELARQQLKELTGEAATLSDEGFFLRVSAITAAPDNGHTGLSRSAIYQQFGLLPIRTHWFDDGLFIVRATPEHKELLGAQVLEIANQTPGDLMAEMQKYFGGTDEAFRAYGHTALFLSPALLHAAGVTPSPDSIALVLTLPAGERRAIDLTAFATSERHPGGRTWRQLHPASLPREGDGWASWLGGSSLPWAYDDVDQTFRYRHLAELDVSHIQFRANIGDGETKLSDFLDSLERRLKADRPRYLLWDQRQNGGGDLTRSADFSRQLHKWLPRDGRVYVLTSNATFSAGIYTSFFPEWADDERTIVVGTRVGDRERFWAETGPPFVLPESGWRILHSLQMHDLEHGCKDRKVCHIRRKRWNLAVGSFTPDERIPERSSDLLAGKDAVVEWVLAEIGGD